jgi:hypothetical protein
MARALVPMSHLSTVVATVAVALLGSSLLIAGESPHQVSHDGDWSLTAAAIVSNQPGGVRDCSRCDASSDVVAGNPLGAFVGLERRTPGDALFAFEASSTASMSGTSEGTGCDFAAQVCPASSAPPMVTHRDTLFSFLLGVHIGRSSVGVELKAGPSLVYGSTQFNPSTAGSSYSDQNAGLTVGLDGVLRLGQRADLVPSLRYSHTDRGSNNDLGLGNRIVRVGVGLRVKLSN